MFEKKSLKKVKISSKCDSGFNGFSLLFVSTVKSRRDVGVAANARGRDIHSGNHYNKTFFKFAHRSKLECLSIMSVNSSVFLRQGLEPTLACKY